MASLGRSICLSIALVACFVSCETPRPSEGPLLVVVVGNDVPDDLPLGLDRPDKRAFLEDDAKGQAIWAASRLAVSSGRLGAASSAIELRGVDDWGDVAQARRIAERLARNSKTLAVIGTTASSTSRAMAPILSRHGIPFLMPIATSPTALLDDDGERFPGVYRLAPSDHRVQGPIAAAFASDRLGSSKTLLVQDIDEGAEAYSRPLCEAADRALQGQSSTLEEFRSSESAERIARFAVDGSYDTIIFCGYVAGAEQLLARLTVEARQSPERPRPKVLLTDGALDGGIAPGLTETYLLFPLPPVDSLRSVRNPDAELLAQRIDSVGAHSYEVYAYDAVGMIGEAVGTNCGQGLGRTCVREGLRSLNSFEGLMFTYTFINGENASAEYFVYRLTRPDGEPLRTELVSVLGPQDYTTER